MGEGEEGEEGVEGDGERGDVVKRRGGASREMGSGEEMWRRGSRREGEE